MEKATSKDFISILAEDKPPLILFRYAEDEQAEKIKETLKEVQSDFPLLNTYEYIIDDNDDNEILAEHLGIVKTPLLVFYKNSCFNRYKDKMFTKKALTTFIGSKKTYAKPVTVKDNA
jgi:hypothetical protein